MVDPRTYRRAGRLPLRVVTSGQRVCVGIGCVMLFIITALMAAWAVVLAGTPFASITGVLDLIPLLAACLSLLWLLRNRAWLEGTTLVLCTTYATRRCDLARAPVLLGAHFSQARLTAVDDTGGRAMHLRYDKLRAPELAAVADAIMAGGRQDPGAWQVVAALRQRAALRQWGGRRVAGGAPGLPGPRL
jgi:hypothetical protein